MTRASDAAVEALVDQALVVAAQAVEAMTPVVRQATYQLLNSAGHRIGRDERSLLRGYARSQLEGTG